MWLNFKTEGERNETFWLYIPGFDVIQIIVRATNEYFTFHINYQGILQNKKISVD